MIYSARSAAGLWGSGRPVYYAPFLRGDLQVRKVTNGVGESRLCAKATLELGIIVGGGYLHILLCVPYIG